MGPIVFSQTFKWLLVSQNQNNDGDKFDKNAMKILDPEVMLLVWS